MPTPDRGTIRGRRNCGVPTFRVVTGEAWRNVLSGTSRAFLFAGLFAVLVGLLACAQARLVVGFTNEAIQFRDSGAAIQIVQLPGAVDGVQCDELTSHPGVVASGALRTGPEITLSAMPSRTTGSLKVSAGFGRLLNLDRDSADAGASGAWIAADLADELALTVPDSITLTNGDSIPVEGTYNYPADGRDQRLAHQVISPVVPTTPFDECWVMIWPDPDAANAVMFLPLIPQDPGPTGPPIPPLLQQANTTLGEAFSGPAKFAALPSVP
jgi:hypothetical protein